MTTTSSYSTAPDAARREKARQHFAWQERVAERADLSLAARLAAWALARRRNVLSGRCDPSYADIAEGMGAASVRTAIRALAALERAGLIVIDPRVGRGHRNQVTFIMPEKVTEPCQGFDARNGDKSGAKRPPDAARKGDRLDPEKVTELCHPNMKRAPREPSEHGERECAQRARAPDPAHGPLTGPRRKKDRAGRRSARREGRKGTRGREAGRQGQTFPQGGGRLPRVAEDLDAPLVRQRYRLGVVRI